MLKGRRGRVRNEISGGIFFSAVIQGRDITVVVPSDLTPAMAGLRDASEVFAGRDDDLERVLGLLDPSAESSPRTATVSGLPGVGKTELVVHAAHAALRAGWFPGGVLFIDMFGYDPERAITVGAALERLLRKVGMPAEHIPAAEQDRSDVLRSVLATYAEEGKPVLVVIDNVSSSVQAAPLIPAAGKVIVTSRHKLPLQNAQRLDLGKLGESAGIELLAGELGLVAGTDTRVAAHPDDAARIARLCDGLPLALQIVAALLAAHPARALSTMADDLEDTQTRLDEMRFREPGGAELAVRAAFDLSYGQLDADQAKFFQLLTVNPGPEISTAAAAAMASLDERVARRFLDELEQAHLIESGSADGRWRMHDLLHVYSVELGLKDENRKFAALHLLAYYSDTAKAAARHLDPTGTRPPDDLFADRVQALAWLDTEYPNLRWFGTMVIFSQPAALSPFTTVDVFLRLWRYFELRRLTDDWIRFTEFALYVARELDDRGREAEALTKLGGAFRQARRFDDAVSACREAVDIERELGNRHGEGVALNNLDAALINAKRYDEAHVSAQQAVAIFQETGDRYREGIAASHLGGALTSTGRHAEGVAAYEKAAAIFREAGDQRSESGVLTNLGVALRDGGRDLEEVIVLHRRSAATMAETGDQYSQAGALVNLTGALIDAGHPDEALSVAQDAVALLRDAEDSHGLGLALHNLGSVLLDAGRAGDAAEALGKAVTAYHRSGDQDAEAEEQIGLGKALEGVGDREAAITAFRAAADIGQVTANRGIEGHALGYLGNALWKANRPDESITTLRAAVTASHAARDLDGEARALFFLGTTVWAGVDIDAAIPAFRDAAKLYRQAGSGQLAELASGALQRAKSARLARDELRARLAAGRFEDVIADYHASSLHQTDYPDIVQTDYPDLVGSMAAVVGSMAAIAGSMAAELGSSLRRAGRAGQAVTFLEEAATAFHEAGRPDRERAARAELDAARQAQLDAQAAADALERVLRSPSADGQELRAALDEASRHLGPHDARFFRLLSASPGPDISLAAAAILAVADRDVILARLDELAGLAASRNHKGLFRRMSDLYRSDAEVARGAFRVLTQMRLVEPLADPERWRLPTAVRPFAAQQGRKHAKQDLRGPVRTLLFLYYLAGAYDAAAALDSGIIAPALRGQEPALRWLAAEYPDLVATVHEAGDDNDDLSAVIALDVTRSLAHITHLEGRSDDAVALGPIARRAARRLHDRHAEAVVLRNLGIDLICTERPDEAITALHQALSIYQDLGDLTGEGTTLTNLGGALTQAGQFAEADTVLRDAIDIHRQQGRPLSEAVALVGLATLLNTTGQLEAAIIALRDADRIFRKIGDQRRRSGALVQLADALRRTGHDEEAIRAYRRAAMLARLSGELPLAAIALSCLAEIYRATGQETEADDVLHELAQLAQDFENTPAGGAQSDVTVTG